jgi:hypothetical protein
MYIRGKADACEDANSGGGSENHFASAFLLNFLKLLFFSGCVRPYYIFKTLEQKFTNMAALRSTAQQPVQEQHLAANGIL